ncbi:MAG: hypothetical protein H7039_21565 [Bryobacteraceae bacterium]|nr:hypothetical protein [Bryobacteraceae bacterium]
MMGKQLPSISFFATAEDIRPVLAAIESKYDLQYSECGLFQEEQRPIILSLSSLESLGTAATGDASHEPTYLVGHALAAINIRRVPQRKGGTRFAVDQLNNLGTIVFRPGGKYFDSAVISGLAGTVRDEPISKELLTAFSAEIRSRFTAVKECWVGPAALRNLREGARLTNAVTAQPEYDLVEQDQPESKVIRVTT